MECYGYVDVLICNSSMKLKAPIQSVSLELDRNIMDINYFGPSTLAKGGWHAFFDCLRAEVEEYGIVVSTISHTFINASEPPPAVEPAPKQNILAECEYDVTKRCKAHIQTYENIWKCSWDESGSVCFSTDITSQLTHGVQPSVLANEILQTVNRKRKEVVLAHPIPRVALYLRSLFPPFLFAVLAAGVKDSVLAEQIQ
ncbi:hypothetical protein XENOCAPTIV_022606 [Xenoophorus captivus]|uniref:Uncharacterized protein n=1 Tax=Xenoophorus captivus TaxID=1517983 RepID=A0ABV0RD58_9TELE